MPIASFEDWACSGATRKNKVAFDGTDDKAAEEAQIKHVTSSTNLVTISLGGNDVGFADVVGDCVVGPRSVGTHGIAKVV